MRWGRERRQQKCVIAAVAKRSTKPLGDSGIQYRTNVDLF